MSEMRVAAEFSPYLGGRYVKDGPWSGEEFRKKKLLDVVGRAIAEGSQVQINFDGVSGTPTSFLEEAFGGLVRDRPQWTLDQLNRAVKIAAPNTPRLTAFMGLAHEYMVRAFARRTLAGH